MNSDRSESVDPGKSPTSAEPVELSPEDAAALLQPQKAPLTAPVVGRKLPKKIGSYDVLKEINRGGMGIVYKAIDPTLKREVAIKVLLAGQGAKDEDLKRFYREAQATARLQHPNIVPIYAVGTHEGMPYLVMDFIEGRSAKQLKEQGHMTPRLALTIIEGVAEGLHHAHQHGVIHRDVKPGNILIDQSERVLLMDFGLARRVDEDLEVTQAGTTMGTPSYMAPEQAEGKLTEVDAQSDVYSAGACLYELLTGEPPFEGNTIMAVLRNVIEATPVAPRRRDPKIHVDVETICLKCLEKEKKNRYRTAKDLADDIRRFNEGEAITAKPLGKVATIYRKMRRHKEASLAAALAILFGLAALAYTINEAHRVTRDQKERREEALQSALEEGASLSAKAHDTAVQLNQISQADFAPRLAEARTLLNEANSAYRHAEAIAPQNADARQGLEKLKRLENSLEVRHFIAKARAFLSPAARIGEPSPVPNFAGAEFAAQEALDRDPSNAEARELLRTAVGIRQVTIETYGEAAEVFARKMMDAQGHRLLTDSNDPGKSLGPAPVNTQLEPGVYIITYQRKGEPPQQVTLSVTREARKEELDLKIPLKAHEENMAWIDEGSVSMPHTGDVRVPAFSIDRFEYPNKAGAVPATGVTFIEAQKICHQQNKQLCTSAQWLRACMGNEERRYPYAKSYIGQTCAAGFDPNLQKDPLVSGLFSRCHTPEGVYDMSGNAAEWTDPESADVDQSEAVFGGDWTSSYSVPDITISCRGRRLPGEVRREQLGFRCCKAK